MKLYDFAADGVKRALPTARIGGPEVTGPNGARTQQFLRDFIEHCLRGTNYATGKIGSPLDLVTFHAKGAPRVQPDGRVRMSVSNQLRAISNGFAHRRVVPGIEEHPDRHRRVGPGGLRRVSGAHESLERLSQRDDVLELHRRTDRAHVSTGRSAQGEPARQRHLGVPVRRPAVLRRIPRPGDERHRQAGAQCVPDARADERAAGRRHGARPRCRWKTSAIGACARPRTSRALASRDTRSAAVLVWNYHDDDLPGAAGGRGST